jgi:hypothetical protein
MKKNEKKIDKAIVKVLTEACNIAEQNYNGFSWLTHFVSFSNFPDSLCVICIFDTNEQLEQTDMAELRLLIKEKLLSININIKDLHRQVNFDTEENCNSEHHGNWNQRFNASALTN